MRTGWGLAPFIDRCLPKNSNRSIALMRRCLDNNYDDQAGGTVQLRVNGVVDPREE